MSAKVLLVEDNPLNADMLGRRLTKRGFSVVLAVDGLEALAHARTEQPDVVLMDVDLPTMDGWEATRRLKADPATAHIPVIALTAHAMTSDRDRSIEVGCDDFETKPIELTHLLAKVESLLTRRRVS